MIGFNDSAMMMAHLQRKQGGRLGIHFAHNVGVAPGTTTLCMGCQHGQGSPIAGSTAVEGAKLMTGDCPPDPTNQYMVDKVAFKAAAAARAAAPVKAYEPYGTESQLKGRTGVNLLGRLRGALRDTTGPFGMSWNSIIILAGVAALGGVGLGYLASKR